MPAPKRADARRNEQTLLEAAAAVFAKKGVDAPVRDIAAEAGVGMGTIYRHFPTRADLVVAVYRLQVDAVVEAAPALLASAGSPRQAVGQWVDVFLDLLVTKHGLAAAMSGDADGFHSLHSQIVTRVIPAFGQVLEAAAAAGEVRPDVDPGTLLRAIGNLCIGIEDGSGYDARAMVKLLLDGLATG